MKIQIKNISIISLAIFFEYLRDYIFINLNIYIEFLQNINNGLNVINYTDTRLHDLIQSFSLELLINIKWTLSIGFAFIFFVIGVLFSKINFNRKQHLKFTYLLSISGSLILIISFLIFWAGQQLNVENENNFYSISLELSHFVQSSLFPISFFLISWSINQYKIFNFKKL